MSDKIKKSSLYWTWEERYNTLSISVMQGPYAHSGRGVKFSWDVNRGYPPNDYPPKITFHGDAGYNIKQCWQIFNMAVKYRDPEKSWVEDATLLNFMDFARNLVNIGIKEAVYDQRTHRMTQIDKVPTPDYPGWIVKSCEEGRSYDLSTFVICQEKELAISVAIAQNIQAGRNDNAKEILETGWVDQNPIKFVQDLDFFTVMGLIKEVEVDEQSTE